MPAIEVEIRSIVKEPEKAQKLLEKKYPLVKEKTQSDDYFSHPSRDFYANPELREYVRIRSEKGKQTFEYHKAFIKTGEKTHSEEFGVGIDNPKRMKEILLELGFAPLVTVKKTRKVFDAGDFEADLDQIKDLGFFLEIEAKKDFGGVEKTKQKCIEFLESLGIEYISSPEKGYPDMLIEKLPKKPDSMPAIDGKNRD